jgi:isoleucyl-tRNA synthetase
MADDTSILETDERDYRETVFLPQTLFPMRAGLPKLEPELLSKWVQGEGLYAEIRKDRQAKNAPLYVLHDGPPYANGAIHIGHALQKTLKDFVVRSRFALGYDVDYVPGWDCHGLPIEWKVEEAFRAKGRTKDQVSKAEFRAACRDYALHWIDVQRDAFKRLGVLGDWDHRYATMDYSSEAAIVAEFHKFLMSGQLYRGSKPVMWSPVERTALADAEVEYHPHSSPTVWVKFPVKAYDEDRYAHSDDPRGGNVFRLPPNDASIVIWTTTPWTIPANRAIAYGPTIEYGLYEVEAMDSDLPFAPWAKPGDRLIVADKLAEDVRANAKISSWRRVEDIDPQGLICTHPLADMDAGYRFDVPLLAGDHVTDGAGTGFVHTAPGHGADDYLVWLANGYRDIPETVDPDGAYYPSVPLFGGMKVMETDGKKSGKFGAANSAVMDKLIDAGTLLARGRLEHSYPHSWRSGAPVIFRNTPQWFIRMDVPISIQGERRTLRETALAAIDSTAFYPETGGRRMRGMVESRPDWLISRQRAWGTPLAMFVDKRTGEPLQDADVNARIVAAVNEHGADAWYTLDPAIFLGEGRDPADYEQVQDILDVWFDSGSTHAFTLEGRAHTRWPADLYLEGTDQARGWFQSSLLESCGTRGRAPYNAVLTHGFTMDENGEKMSKSKGNTIDPQDVIRQSGAEIIRLWVAMTDYAEDQRIGPTILQTTADAYRKLRNTVRYLLGALEGFEEAEQVGYADMPPLERLILHRLWALDGHVRDAYENYRFNDVFRPVSEFCAGDLSSLYFDIRKDSLYCDKPSEMKRRAARTVMHEVFMRLTAWLAPLAPFTMEEAWSTRFPNAGPNALRALPERVEAWEMKSEDEAERWRRLLDVRTVVTGALELARQEKKIGSSLEACPTVHLDKPSTETNLFKDLDAAELFITSGAEIKGFGFSSFTIKNLSLAEVDVQAAQGQKCDRCWRILPEVKAATKLCLRCTDAVADWDARREH